MRMLLLTSLLLLAGCQSGPTWEPIFNGNDLDGWTPKIVGEPLGEDARGTFRVIDGAITVCYDEYDDFAGEFGHLFYDEEFSHYRMRMEYRFMGDQMPGGPGWAFRNSGIMMHGQPAETMRIDQSFPVSLEVQLLGGDGTNERSTGNVCTPGTDIHLDGKLDRRHCINSTSPTFHGDDWVTIEIEVHGSEVIRHYINGELVFEYTDPMLDDRDGDARRWREARGGEALLGSGSISLQAESHPCAFRNIEIMVLDE